MESAQQKNKRMFLFILCLYAHVSTYVKVETFAKGRSTGFSFHLHIVTHVLHSHMGFLILSFCLGIVTGTFISVMGNVGSNVGCVRNQESGQLGRWCTSIDHSLLYLHSHEIHRSCGVKLHHETFLTNIKHNFFHTEQNKNICWFAELKFIPAFGKFLLSTRLRRG